MADTLRSLLRLSRAGDDLMDVLYKAGETALAAQSVIGHRMALGLAAIAAPGEADHQEFMLMGTEKVEAFTAATTAWLQGMERLHSAALDYVLQQNIGFARAALALGTAGSPERAARIHKRFFIESFARGSRHALAMADLGNGVSARTLAPVHRKATRNALRLGRDKTSAR